MRRRTDQAIAVVWLLVPLGGMGLCWAQRVVSAPAPLACAVDPQLPAFDVAAITPVAKKDRGTSKIGEYGLPRFELRGVSLSLLLSFSFDVQPASFLNAPRGLEDAVFDVQVESGDGTALTYEALKPRMQQMLQQRFCLKAHAGTKQASGYALVVAKGGAKLTPVTRGGEGGSAFTTQYEVNGPNVDMRALAGMLVWPAGRPVQDQTGLKGKYMVVVKFAPATDAQSALPSIFTALKEQVGLELRAAQVPVNTLTIERLNLVPTEN